MSNFEPIVEEKFDFFFLCVLMNDCISKVLLIKLEVLLSSFDFWLLIFLSIADPARFPLR